MTYDVSTKSEDELWFASTCAASTAANFLCFNFSNSWKESCHCAQQTAEISGETSRRVSILLGVKKNLLLFTSPHKKTVVGFWRPELCGASKNKPIQNSFRLKFPSNSMFFFASPDRVGTGFLVRSLPCMFERRPQCNRRCRTLWNDAIHVSWDGRIGRALLQYLRTIARNWKWKTLMIIC